MVSRYTAQPAASNTRELILDAAAGLLQEVGYQHMTMDEVAKRAGLGKGTTYIYFEAKRDLALSVMDRLSERLRERLKTIIRSPGSPEKRLKNALVERVMVRFDQAKKYRSSIDEIFANLRPLLLERRRINAEQEAVLFVELLVEGRTLGIFDFEDPLETAHAMLTATSSLLPFSLSTAELGSRSQLQSRSDFLAELLIQGISRRCQDQPEREPANGQSTTGTRGKE